MRKYYKFVNLGLLLTFSGCGGGGGDGTSGNPQYSLTLTNMALNKKGSSQILAVTGLPARGATLTQQ